MTIEKELYLTEMDSLIADARLRLLAQLPDTEVYTISIWTDPNRAVSAVNFDTIENSVEQIRRSNEWNKSYYDRYLAEGDAETAQLFRPMKGRNQNPADFRFSKIASVEHRSFAGENKPILLAGGDKPVDSTIWPVLESLLQIVQERARSLYSDLRLHPDARIAVSRQESWYDFEIPMSS